jgi:hypothetical protein
LILFVIVTIVAPPSSSTGGTLGAFESGNALYTDCLLTDNVEDDVCTGIISGAWDMMVLWGFRCEGNPKDIDRRRFRDIVVNYLRDHPVERGSTPAASLIVQAIQQAFNCKAPPGIQSLPHGSGGRSD